MAFHPDKYTKLSPPLPKKNKTKQAFRNNYILHNHIPDLAAAQHTLALIHNQI